MEPANLPRRYAVLSMAWETVGLCAIAEGQVDLLLGTYTKHVPDDLRTVLLKRLSAEERLRGLRLFVKHRGLTAEYPDLANLLKQVGGLRNRLAHGNLVYVEPDVPDEDNEIPDEPISEGVGIIANRGTGHVSLVELEQNRQDAERLVGLLHMLISETGAGGFDPPQVDEEGCIPAPLGGRQRLTTPREPMVMPRLHR